MLYTYMRNDFHVYYAFHTKTLMLAVEMKEAVHMWASYTYGINGFGLLVV